MKNYNEIYCLQDIIVNFQNHYKAIHCNKTNKETVLSMTITHIKIHWKIPMHFLINSQKLQVFIIPETNGDN